MKKHILFLSLLSSILFITSCQKELSFENGGTPSEGTLQSDLTGECLPKTVEGIYEAGTPLVGTTNYIDVEVNVITPGSYTIYSDTLNGIFFRATGVFTAAGTTTVRLKGSGTPIDAGVDTYVISYGASICTVAVTTLPDGAGAPAEFTLVSTGGNCSVASQTGDYIQGVLISPGTNTVELSVQVTTIGTYDITTTASNGITFKGTGALLSQGPGTIILKAEGTPGASGATPIVVNAGAAGTCNFSVTVIGQATYSIVCGSEIINGQYEENVNLDGSNTITIQVQVTTPGGYNITGTAAGMTFSASGSFTTGGTTETITLLGTGKPNADGDITVPLIGGTPACSVEVTVDPATNPGTIDWKFTEGPTTYQGAASDVTLDVQTLPPPISMTVSILSYFGESTGGDEIDFGLIDVAGGITVNETYTSNASTTNAVIFSFFSSGTTEYYADPQTTGKVMTFKITAHNTTTKTIEGTFSGTAENEAGATKTITAGTFKGTYQ
jgi:hypothetical protein